MADFARATEAQTAQLASAAQDLASVFDSRRTLLIRNVARWKAFQNVLGPYDVEPATVLGKDLARQNEELATRSFRLLMLGDALGANQAELVGVLAPDGRVTVGVAPRGLVPSDVQAFPFVAVIIVAGVGALVWKALGTADLYMEMQKEQALRDQVDAFNAQRQLELVKMAQQSGDPKQLAQVQAIIDQITTQTLTQRGNVVTQAANAAKQWLSGAASTITNSIEDTGASVSGVAVLLALLWLTRDKRR